MKTTITLLVLLVAACQPVPPEADHVGPYGSLTYADGPDTMSFDWYDDNVIEAVEAWQAALDLAGVDCNAGDTMTNLPVIWRAEKWEGGKRRGLYSPSNPIQGARIRIYNDPDEPRRAFALTHEIGHRVLHKCGQDYGHDNMQRWHDEFGAPSQTKENEHGE